VRVGGSGVERASVGGADAPAQARARRRGMALMLLAAVLLTTSDAVSKALTERYPVGELIFLRGLFVMVPVLWIVRARGGAAALTVVDVRGQVARAGLFVISSVLFVTSLSYLPLPLVTSLSFVSPIFMTVLAIPLLGERVSWQTWCAVLAGFAGVVIAIDPSGAAWSWAAVLPVIGAFSGALRDILTRRISARESSTSIMFYSMGLTMLFALVTVPFGWRWPAGIDLLLFPAVGLLMGTAHFFSIEALRLCEVSLLAPLRYAMILWSIALGVLVWQELPSVPALIGTAIIMMSGVYVVRRQSRAVIPVAIEQSSTRV
jgi:drug/metabolite transporter (DMT)-like permease